MVYFACGVAYQHIFRCAFLVQSAAAHEIRIYISQKMYALGFQCGNVFFKVGIRGFVGFPVPVNLFADGGYFFAAPILTPHSGYFNTLFFQIKCLFGHSVYSALHRNYHSVVRPVGKIFPARRMRVERFRNRAEVFARCIEHLRRALFETEHGYVATREIGNTVTRRVKTQRILFAARVRAHRAVCFDVGMGFFFVRQKAENRFLNDGRNDYVFGDEVDDFLSFHIQLSELFSAAEYSLARLRRKTQFRHKIGVRLQANGDSAELFRKRNDNFFAVGGCKRKFVVRAFNKREQRPLSYFLGNLEVSVRTAIRDFGLYCRQKRVGRGMLEHLAVAEIKRGGVSLSCQSHNFLLLRARGYRLCPPNPCARFSHR